MRIGALSRLASLRIASDTVTAFGGRIQTWTQIAQLWVALEEGARAASGADQPPLIRGTGTAIARDNPLAEQGNRLVLGGDNWRLIRLVRGAPTIGLMTLFLEKEDP